MTQYCTSLIENSLEDCYERQQGPDGLISDKNHPEQGGLSRLGQGSLLRCPGLIPSVTIFKNDHLDERSSPPYQPPSLCGDTPPPEARQEPPTHVLDYPEVGGEEHHNKDEGGDEGVHNEAGAEVDSKSQPLEYCVKEYYHLV